MRTIFLLVGLLQLLACSTPTEPVLSWDGYGPVNFGTPLKEVEKILGTQSESLAPADPACTYVRFSSLHGIRFMVENGIITRAEADSGVPNSVGVAVGDSFSQVKAKNPAAEIQPHKYDENGHYLTLKSPDGAKALVLEEGGGKITAIRAGLQPSVSYVEGCS